MHISEGVLSAPVLFGGAAIAAAGLGISLKKMKWDEVMKIGALSAAFFVASLIHLPLGPGKVHLVLNGLLGAILGWSAFPAIAVALFLQAILFQMGGLTSLGVNISIMAVPAVLCGLLFRPFFHKARLCLASSFACGALSVAFSGCFAALALALSGEDFINSAWAIIIFNSPVMLIEGFFTAAAVRYLVKEKSKLLEF